MKKNYVALVVLYRPTSKEISNVVKLSDVFDKIYVFDNTEELCNINYNFENQNVDYISYNKNCGLARAYNIVLEKAINENRDFLCILDQDSNIEKDSILKIMNYIENNNVSDVAICAPYIKVWDKPVDSSETSEVKWAINSGSFLNVKLVKRYNLKYDEAYFIDRLDRDFCKQIYRKNLKILKIADTVMRQELGVEKNGNVTHNPLRNYYIFRNRRYYNDKYYCHFLSKIITFGQDIRHILELSKDKKMFSENIRMYKMAVEDYSHHKLGKK